MPNIIATQRNHITSGVLGDKDTVSCAGVPGTGRLDSAYIYVNTYINTALDDAGYLWFANTSGYVRQTDMRDDYGDVRWWSACRINNDPFTLTYGGDYPDLITRYGSYLFQREAWKDNLTVGTFTGNTTYNVTTSPATTSAAENAGYWESGWTIADCNPVTSDGVTTIKLDIAYPVYYGATANQATHSDTAVTFDSVQFTFDIEELIEYYPFAVYISGWQSCNRTGGSLTKYSGSSWNNLQNIENNTDESTVFNYDSGSWNIAPKIGNE